jgi:hypothetical protein
MKTRCIISLCVLPFALLQMCSGQGFVNFNFERASLTAVPAGQFGSLVPISSGLPGWTGYLGTTQVTQVLQNNFTLGDASIDIIGPGWTNGIIEGLYTVVLEEGVPPGNPQASPINASISQSGMVPATAHSLQFKEWGSVNFTVTFAGQNLALIPVGTGSGVGLNYTLYGADVSAFAGQTGALTITELAGPGIVPATPDYFDSFVFSPQSVPEPNPLTLLGICACCFAAGKTRQPRLASQLQVNPLEKAPEQNLPKGAKKTLAPTA